MPNTHSSIVGQATNTKDCTHAPAPAPAPDSLPCQQMAPRKTLLAAAAMALVATAALLPATASAETYTVGDDSGWDVGVDYFAWASGKNFKVGDTLVFRLRPKKEGQDVVQVNLRSFESCIPSDDARVLSTGGNAVNVVLAQSGDFFFVCRRACVAGMKLRINVQ